MSHVRSRHFTPSAREPRPEPTPTDLSALTPETFTALPASDRARLFREAPDRYRELRDTAGNPAGGGAR